MPMGALKWQIWCRFCRCWFSSAVFLGTGEYLACWWAPFKNLNKNLLLRLKGYWCNFVFPHFLIAKCGLMFLKELENSHCFCAKGFCCEALAQLVLTVLQRVWPWLLCPPPPTLEVLGLAGWLDALLACLCVSEMGASLCSSVETHHVD